MTYSEKQLPDLSSKQQLEVLKLVFDHIDNGALVIDPDGYITHFNKPYGEFLQVDPALQIGKHVTDVVENSRMHIVAKTGVAEINVSHSIRGQNMLVQRIPIKENGKVIAVLGHVLFKNIQDVGKLAHELSELQSQVKRYQKELSSLRATRYTFDDIIGASTQIKALLAEARKAAKTSLPILISGESGTGKELFAQSIHNSSTRSAEAFIRLNCAAIPKDLLESELFGYDRGAFTGAKSTGKAGKFELADKGTIFLDEIGDLPLEMQPKLLRVLEEKEFERIGGNRVIKADFRLISASNQNLAAMVERGEFRADLFYRLNVVPLHIPPLRERTVDILPLARHLLKSISEEGRFGATDFSREAETVLQNHSWPGNVRELNNVIERILATSEDATVTPADLPFYLHQINTTSSGEQSLLKEVVAKAEKTAIHDALKMTAYNKAQAAAILGIHRTLLYKKMQKYGLPLSGE
ncbi:MAG: sigma 54-interacting transcriptional regulator [Desulfopila sp.]|nr:sigma 54-interacting transcriptional regulator [Desulfopila sp.]